LGKQRGGMTQKLQLLIDFYFTIEFSTKGILFLQGDYTRAQEDCLAAINGFLVAIESEEEELFLNQWIEERGSGGICIKFKYKFSMSSKRLFSIN